MKVRKNIVLVALIFVGCSDDPCSVFAPDCGARNALSSTERSELLEYGVTLAEEGVANAKYITEGPDSVPVFEDLYFYFKPAPGTEGLDPQYDGLNLNLDSTVSARSELAFIDSNGVILDRSNNSSCFENLNDSSSNTIVAFFESWIVPDEVNYLLQSWVKCIPASAERVVHRYVDDEGEERIASEVELVELKSWRERVQPIRCQNGLCSE